MTPEGFRPAPASILAVVGRLIATHFPHLAAARLLVLARESAEPTGEGQFAVAAAGVPTGDAEARQFDYVMWFAWDVWQALSDVDRDALVFHELMHCGRDEAGNPELKHHDAGVFNRELELYGAWWVDAQQRFKALNTP